MHVALFPGSPSCAQKYYVRPLTPPAQKSEGDSVLGGQRSHVIIECEEEGDLGTRLLCMLATECSIVSILPQCGALRNVCSLE